MRTRTFLLMLAALVILFAILATVPGAGDHAADWLRALHGRNAP